VSLESRFIEWFDLKLIKVGELNIIASVLAFSTNLPELITIWGLL
jgi:hypothetical protein